jgi:simple sugar transport system ATP-binding protein
MLGVTKRYGAVLANDRVDLALRRGEVHALLGENGAGKSTLSKILYGFTRPDAGTVRLDGEPVRMGSPSDARALGIGMVFQNFMLIPALSVRENIALFLPDLPAVLHRAALEERIRRFGERFGLAVDPEPRCASFRWETSRRSKS